jgi:hypothetical protein
VVCFNNTAVITSGVMSVMDDEKLNDHMAIPKVQEYTSVISIHERRAFPFSVR